MVKGFRTKGGCKELGRCLKTCGIELIRNFAERRFECMLVSVCHVLGVIMRMLSMKALHHTGPFQYYPYSGPVRIH